MKKIWRNGNSWPLRERPCTTHIWRRTMKNIRNKNLHNRSVWMFSVREIFCRSQKKCRLKWTYERSLIVQIFSLEHQSLVNYLSIHALSFLCKILNSNKNDFTEDFARDDSENESHWKSGSCCVQIHLSVFMRKIGWRQDAK